MAIISDNNGDNKGRAIFTLKRRVIMKKSTVLKMTSRQYKHLQRFTKKFGIEKYGTLEFYLLGQPLMNTKTILVLLLSKKQGDKLSKIFEKMGLVV